METLVSRIHLQSQERPWTDWQEEAERTELALQFIRTGLAHLGLTNSGVGEILKNFPGWSEDGLSHFATEKPKVQKRCDSIAWVVSETVLTCKALLMLSLRMWAFCACCNWS